MDQKELQEKIALYYSKLPPKAQEVFASMNWLETLKTISQKYGLNESQIETLGTETTLVLLGIIHLVEYEESLTNELGLSIDATDKMLMEIEDSIIKTIRPQLVQAFEDNSKPEQEQTSSEVVQKLDKRMEDLPVEIKQVVQKSEYQTELYNIAKGYNLTVTQMGFLETAVNDLIVGSIHPEEFQGFLGKNLTIPKEKIENLVSEINERIFLKIRKLLKQASTTTEDKTPAKEGEWSQQAHKEDAKVFHSAGIEIVPERLEIAAPASKTSENREDMIKNIEKPELIKMETVETKKVHPILLEKLSGSFQIGAVKTEHTLENITKTENADKKSKSNPKIDPYLEIPE